MSNFGHAKSAIKNFHQISNFSFPRGGDVELWSYKICHKIFLPDFQLFISGGGGGGMSKFGYAKSAIRNFHQISNFSFLGGGRDTLNFGHAKSAIKNFHQISNFSFLGGGGDFELWSCKICHKKFSPDFQLFISKGGGGMLNFGHTKSAIKFFCQISNFLFQGVGVGVCQNLVMPNLPLEIFTIFPTSHFWGVGGIH